MGLLDIFTQYLYSALCLLALLFLGRFSFISFLVGTGSWAFGQVAVSSFTGGEVKGLHGHGVMGGAVCLETVVPWSHLTFPSFCLSP